MDEECGVLRREADEDLVDVVINKLWWGAVGVVVGSAASPTVALLLERHRRACKVLDV